MIFGSIRFGAFGNGLGLSGKTEKEKSVNKLIAKTAAITFAALLTATLLVYGCFAIFAPAALSDFYMNAGNESLSLKYAERAYRKDGTQERLIIVIKRAIAAGDKKKICENCEILFDEPVSGISDEEKIFLQNKYCAALYSLGKTPEAIRRAASFSDGYYEGNPLEGLVFNAISEKDAVFLRDVLSSLELIAESPELDESNRARLKEEISVVKDFIDKADNPAPEL